MFGYQIPQSLKQAREFDRLAGNHKWEKSDELEHEHLREYETFIDKGKFSETKIPKGYKKISVHSIFSVKHDFRFKTCGVVDGHLTDTPIHGVYSGVVSLQGF